MMQYNSMVGYLPCHKVTIAPIILFGVIPVANVCNKNTGAHLMNAQYIHIHITLTLKYLYYGCPCYQQH